MPLEIRHLPLILLRRFFRVERGKIADCWSLDLSCASRIDSLSLSLVPMPDLHNAIALFYGVAACSWVPHWACHYYRLETRTTFVVGKWRFSRWHSLASLGIYSVMIALNLMSIISIEYRFVSAIISGVSHVSIGLIHVYRLWRPFHFEVFGYEWSLAASRREVLIVIPFGLVCLAVAVLNR